MCCGESSSSSGRFRPGPTPPACHTSNPSRSASGVSVVERGTTAYLKLAWHAPARRDPDFFPMLVLDAVLTGAKGMNLWSSFRTPPPQRSARLYRALVDRRLASTVSGALLPTEHPFLYIDLADGDATGVSLAARGGGRRRARPRCATNGVTERSWQGARISFAPGWSSRPTA